MPCPGIAACRTDCLHRGMVEAYQDAHHAHVLAAEAATMGWATELAEHRERHGAHAFRDWLTGGGWEPWRLREDDPGLDYDPQAQPDDDGHLDAWSA